MAKKTGLAAKAASAQGAAGLAGDAARSRPGEAAAQAWPADKIERRALVSLIPYARNARTHSEAQVAQLAASIREFGWTMPVLVDERDSVIAGHGRLLAAERLALTEVPVMVARGWSAAQIKAYRIADNRLALNAGWDDELLVLELGDLREVGFDLGLTGFEAGEIDELFAKANLRAGLTDANAEQALPERAASREADVWVLGNHRLGCGDATDPAMIERVLGGAVPPVMITDPPYGVDYDPEWRLQAGVNKPHQIRAEGRVENDDRADWREAWALFPGDVAYVWHGGLHSSRVQASLEAAGFEIRSQIIWPKPSLVIGRGHYHWQHEPCWYAVRKGATGRWQGDRKQSTVWPIANMHRTQGNVDDGKTNHSTQKPVECMLRPMLNNTRAGEAVYEPFCGSGTSLIAAEQSGRRCFAVELNPAYVDMAVLRWQAFTGLSAQLETDGRSFADVRAERLGEDDARPEAEAHASEAAAR